MGLLDFVNILPDVNMTLTPVSSLPSAFSGLYIQGKTKVKGTLSAEGKYDATIETLRMKVEGVYYDADDDYTSGYLNQYGSVEVHGEAKDNRGLVGSNTQTITVIAYSNPRLLAVSGESDVVVARCDKNGNLNDSGTYLVIKAKRSYSKVVSAGTQRNFCKIQYRYKAAGGTYSAWNTILESNSLASDEIRTGALLNGTLSDQTSYVVQVQVIDDMGESAHSTFTIPSGKVYMHRDGRRRSMTFGGYVEEDDTFALADGIQFMCKGGGNIDTLALGKKIAAYANVPVNLNDYKTPGNYYSENATNSQYIQNSPYTAGGFGLTVREVQITGNIRQELFYARNTWIRDWNGVEWSDWLRYLTTNTADTAAVDYVVEEVVPETLGTESWTYKKWKSGAFEAYGTFKVRPSQSTQEGALYKTNFMTVVLPFATHYAVATGNVSRPYWLLSTSTGLVHTDGRGIIMLQLYGIQEFNTEEDIWIDFVVHGRYK